ncbi:MAG: dephospho-CoA kinase [Bacteroidales bacterium]
MAVCLVCTGGIGSGKSYSVRLFNKLGVPSYIADVRAKELYDSDKVLIKKLVDLLGGDIISGGVLRKDIMAAKIFPNPSLLSKVNNIVHPRVLEDFNLWKSKKEQQGHKVVLLETAIYFETPIFHSAENKVIVVTAPYDIRIERVMKRDNISEEQVKERIARQYSEQERLKRADFIIFADGERAVLPQILNILDAVNYFD